jgi:hypothetical protein
MPVYRHKNRRLTLQRLCVLKGNINERRGKNSLKVNYKFTNLQIFKISVKFLFCNIFQKTNLTCTDLSELHTT